jgi:hypothetical protein
VTLQTMLESMFLYCPTCARETLTEAPPCPDGHGENCPDRACLECGTALSDAPLIELVRSVQRPHRSRRAA